jgi:hypothetical protein
LGAMKLSEFCVVEQQVSGRRGLTVLSSTLVELAGASCVIEKPVFMDVVLQQESSIILINL